MSSLWKCLIDNTHYINDLPCKKFRCAESWCVMNMGRPFLPVVMGAVMSDPGVHVCNCASGCSHTHTECAHTGRKWVRGRLVEGDCARSVCHSWTVPSGLLSKWVCVHAWCFPYVRLLFTSISDTSPDVSVPAFSSTNSDVRQQSLVYLAQIVEFVSCHVNVFDKWSACVPLNRMHSRLDWCHAESRQSGVY